MYTDIALARLTAQRIAQANFAQPENVVQHMLAMQAQDYQGGLWSIGLRTKKATKQAVEQAIIDKKIVRTWPMRGTLHFMHADDATWMVKLLAHRATATAKNRRVSMGLSDDIMQQVETALRQELAGGKAVRRDILRQKLAQKVTSIPVDAMQYGHILRHFGEQAVICFGPHDDTQPTFVLMSDWLPKAREMERVEALGELARRYVTSHGPVQLRDFAGWGMLTMHDAKLALEIAGSSLATIEVDNITYYVSRDVVKPQADNNAFLLPGFDEYMLGYKDRSAALAPEYSNMIVPGSNGMFLPTIVMGGQVVGTWKKIIKKSNVVTDFTFFNIATQPDKTLLEPALARYKQFLGLI